MWTIFKVSIKFVTILFFFYDLVFWSWGIWDLSSLTRDWTHSRAPCIEKWSLSHWTTREAPLHPFQCLDSHLSSGWKNKSRNYRLLALCLVPSDKCFFFFFPLLWFYFVEPFPISTEIFRNISPNCVPFPLWNTAALHFPAFLAVGCGHVNEVLANGRWTKLILLGLSKAICTQLCSRPQSGFCEWFEALGDGGALDRCLGSWKMVQRCMSSSQIDAHWNVDSA